MASISSCKYDPLSCRLRAGGIHAQHDQNATSGIDPRLRGTTITARIYKTMH